MSESSSRRVLGSEWLPISMPVDEPAKRWPALGSAPTSMDRSCRAVHTWPITCSAMPWTGTGQGAHGAPGRGRVAGACHLRRALGGGAGNARRVPVRSDRRADRQPHRVPGV